jgi:hypothetical protein
MSNPFTIPPQLQQKYSQRFGEECEKITMSWNNELSEWYDYAIKALDFASVAELRVPSKKYRTLLSFDAHGLNMNVIAALANNIENRTPSEMGMTAAVWADVIQLNDEVGRSWEALAEPVHKQLRKEFEIMLNKPKLVVAGEA